ncbi:MDR family MFS transporter [Fictibacillus iocasae]|uniref:MDR family MFS transporter n=1 Tax=Fictibacillus iocasae TaxID=2715437 RepID=A0ABW2NVK4_9BACL
MPARVWLLIIGMVLNVTGSSFLWPVNTIFMVNHLDQTLTAAGVVLMLNAGAGILGNLIGGTMFDRFGGYRTILGGVSITLVCSVLLIFFHSFYIYAILLFVIGFSTGITFPSMYAMAGTIWKEGGRKAFNAIYIAQNAGVAGGAALGGMAASYSFTLSFICNAALLASFFMLVLFSFKNMDGDRAVAPAAESIRKESASLIKQRGFQALLLLCTGYFFAWIAYAQWPSSIAAHTQEMGISVKLYSLLWTVNGALIVLGQPIVNPLLRRFIPSIKAQMMVGYTIFIVSFLVIAEAASFSGFLAGMIILTIGEMLVWPGIPSIAAELAPAGRAGFYQGVVNSTATAGRMIAPLFGGLLVDHFNIAVLFYVLMLFLLISFVLTQQYDRKLLNKATISVSEIKQ